MMSRKSNFIESFSMKSGAYISILALVLLNFALPCAASARPITQSAEGRVRFTSEDGLTKSLEFSASGSGDGSATGEMRLSGPAEIQDQDVDGTGERLPSGFFENLYIEARIECLKIERNRAVMCGTVTGSSIGDYIGQRVLLVVEDNGAGLAPREGDALTWGLYKQTSRDWIPADAELREDDGWRMTWTATDAERRDDQDVPYTRDQQIDCQRFPLSSYAFADITEGEGDIRVNP
jgi:hypothetical protein